MKQIRIITGSGSATESLAWIGTRAGIFTRHGLEAVFPRLEVGGPEAAAGLVRGDWDFVHTGAAPIAESVLQGNDPVVLLRNHLPTTNIIVLTRRDLVSLDQLNGKTVGVLTDAYSGQAGIIARLSIEASGAKANYVGLGTYQNIYNAILDGTADAGALPLEYRFLGQGGHGLNSFDTEVSTLPTIFATTRRLIASDRNCVVRAVKAVVETVHLFKTRPDSVAPILQGLLGFDNGNAVAEYCKYYVPFLPEIPTPALEDAIPPLQALFANKYPAARSLKASDISDTSIIEEVERTGFVDKLYGSNART